MTLYKAFRPNGRDFHTGTVDYGTAFANGETVKHPSPTVRGKSAISYLSASTVAHDLPGASWPLILWEVEFVGESWKPGDTYVNKRAGVELRGIRAVPAHLAFGPGGEHGAAIVETFQALPYDKRLELWNARPPGHVNAYDRAYSAARALGFGALPARFVLFLCDGSWDTGPGAALAVLLRHSIGQKAGISQADYEALTTPWRTLIGPAHPDDKLPAVNA